MLSKQNAMRNLLFYQHPFADFVFRVKLWKQQCFYLSLVGWEHACRLPSEAKLELNFHVGCFQPVNAAIPFSFFFVFNKGNNSTGCLHMGCVEGWSCLFWRNQQLLQNLKHCSDLKVLLKFHQMWIWGAFLALAWSLPSLWADGAAWSAS